MANEPLTQQVSARICAHMNSDHQEALINFAMQLGGVTKVDEVKMTGLTREAMTLEINQEITEIYFDHKLSDSGDAHRTLASMAKKHSHNKY